MAGERKRKDSWQMKYAQAHGGKEAWMVMCGKCNLFPRWQKYRMVPWVANIEAKTKYKADGGEEDH